MVHCRMMYHLTQWDRVAHICAGELTIIVSDNGLSPGRRQTIIWTNAGILLMGPYGTNFSKILIEILIFSFTKMSLKGLSATKRPFCIGLNVLKLGLVFSSKSYTYLNDQYNPLKFRECYVIWLAALCVTSETYFDNLDCWLGLNQTQTVFKVAYLG